MPQLFSNQITNVLLVCPYWRSGSSYLGGMFCKYNNLKNLDELLYDPTIDPTRDCKSASLDENLSYPSATGSISKEMVKFIAEDENNFDVRQWLQENNNWYVKIIADQFAHTDALWRKKEFDNIFQKDSAHIVINYRQDVVGTALSVIETMLSGISHEPNYYLHYRYKGVKEDKKPMLKYEQSTRDHYVDVCEKLFHQSMTPYTDLCNKWIKQNLDTVTKATVIPYENFGDHEVLKKEYSPYKKSKDYINLHAYITDRIKTPKHLNYNNNSFDYY